MKKLMVIFAVALLGISMANAQPGRFRGNNDMAGYGQGFGPGFRGNCMNRIPDLTDEQKEEIQDLRVEFMKDIQDHRNELRELKAEYRTLISSDDPDQNAIEENLDQQTKQLNQMMKKRTNHRLAVRELLNDDQKVFFDNAPRRGRGMGMGMCRRNLN